MYCLERPGWAKDVIFVISDDHHVSLKLWVAKYHGKSDHPLSVRSGVGEVAIVLDFPNHPIDYNYVAIHYGNLCSSLFLVIIVDSRIGWTIAEFGFNQYCDQYWE